MTLLKKILKVISNLKWIAKHLMKVIKYITSNCHVMEA
jgi:hypothetical protein